MTTRKFQFHPYLREREIKRMKEKIFVYEIFLIWLSDDMKFLNVIM